MSHSKYLHITYLIGIGVITRVVIISLVITLFSNYIDLFSCQSVITYDTKLNI